jgi:hypothetical protein
VDQPQEQDEQDTACPPVHTDRHGLAHDDISQAQQNQGQRWDDPADAEYIRKQRVRRMADAARIDTDCTYGDKYAETAQDESQYFIF